MGRNTGQRKRRNVKETEIVAYSKKDYDNDEKSFSDGLEKGKLNWSAFSRLMTHDLLCNTSVNADGSIGDIKSRDIIDALRYPKHSWRTLLLISDELMRVSPHYFRLNSLYSNMMVFCWGVDLFDVKENLNIDTLRKSYSSLVARLETMNLKHEFSKIAKFLPYQDVYFGLVVENQTDFFIQHLSPNVCRLWETQDGLYNFVIDLGQIDAVNINAYPDYVRKAYIDFHDGVLKEQFYKPPADKQICIKLNSQWTYPYPLLIGLIRDLLDLDVYKKLKLQSARTDNYKAIMVKVPIDENTIDKPLLTPETLGIFAEINRENLSDDIGMIYNLGDKGEAVSFKDSSNTRNNVADSVNDIYDSAGISKELYNGSASGTALTFSVQNDSGFVFHCYRQFERWINRYIKIRKYNKSSFKFAFYLLDATVFNRDEVTKRYKEAITFGATVIDKYLASIDMTPSRTMGSYLLHEKVFDFRNHFIPMQTSFNSSVDNETGRPKNSDKGELLSIEGEKTAEGEKHDS